MFILAFSGLIGLIALRELPTRMKAPLVVLMAAAGVGMLLGDVAWTFMAQGDPGLGEWTRHLTQLLGSGAAIWVTALVRQLTRAPEPVAG